jgi:hypothetical protein
MYNPTVDQLYAPEVSCLQSVATLGNGSVFAMVYLTGGTSQSVQNQAAASLQEHAVWICGASSL